MWGATRLPTPLAAAAEADRQLHTSDLLSTAWTLRDAPLQDNPWNQTVLALAAARCEGLSPSSVMLHRFGIRAWGGIALCLAFVATLTALSSTSLQAGLAPGREVSSAAAYTNSKNVPLMKIDEGSSITPRRVEQSPTDADASANSSQLAPQSAAGDDALKPRISDEEAKGEEAGAGTGSGQAKSPGAPGTPQIDVASLPKTSSASRPPSAQSATGSGPSSTRPGRGGTGSEGTVETTQAIPPPWQSASWPAAVDSADRAIRSGRVADRYRDLVRGFFDPNQR